MTALASVAERLDNVMIALEPLITSARLNEDAAFARMKFGEAQTELVAAKRLVNGMLGNLALTQRRHQQRDFAEPASHIVIDGAPGIGTTEQGARVLVTFDRAARIPRNVWPPVEPAHSEGGEWA